jgi:hypothetical protein
MAPARAGYCPVTHLDRRILDAWAATADWHAPYPAAPPDRVTAAEHLIGRRLPQAFRELYLVHDGGSWLNGNMNLLPLDDGQEAGEGSVTRAAATFRGWEWPVPDEIVVIGDDGTGDILGLWLPDEEERPLVVTIGAIFEPGCMGIAGQDLNAFLRARTAYYLLPPTTRRPPGSTPSTYPWSSEPPTWTTLHARRSTSGPARRSRPP